MTKDRAIDRWNRGELSTETLIAMIRARATDRVDVFARLEQRHEYDRLYHALEEFRAPRTREFKSLHDAAIFAERIILNPSEIKDKASKARFHAEITALVEEQDARPIERKPSLDLKLDRPEDFEPSAFESPLLVRLAEIADELSGSDAHLSRLLALRIVGGWSFDRIAAQDNRPVNEVIAQWQKARDHLERNNSEIGSIITFQRVDHRLMEVIRDHPKLLQTLDWRTFERLLAALLETLGYDIELGQGTKDGGIDIIALRRDGVFGPERYLLQAKQWHRRVGVQSVRELLFLKHHVGATKEPLHKSAGAMLWKTQFCRILLKKQDERGTRGKTAHIRGIGLEEQGQNDAARTVPLGDERDHSVESAAGFVRAVLSEGREGPPAAGAGEDAADLPAAGVVRHVGPADGGRDLRQRIDEAVRGSGSRRGHDPGRDDHPSVPSSARGACSWRGHFPRDQHPAGGETVAVERRNDRGRDHHLGTELDEEQQQESRSGDEADQEGQYVALRHEGSRRYRQERPGAQPHNHQRGRGRYHATAEPTSWRRAGDLRGSGVLERGAAARLHRGRRTLPSQPPGSLQEATDGAPEVDQPNALTDAGPRRAPLPHRETALGVHEGSLPGLAEKHGAGVRQLRHGEPLPGA